MKRLAPLIVLVIAGPVVLVVALSGGGGGKTSTAAGAYGAAPATKPAAGPTTLALGHTSLGTFLADGKGRTLYLFEADRPDVSNCSGACASVWPPLTATGRPEAARGVAAGKVGTIQGADGRRQVTYAGHPLYHYTGDTGPGATQGQGLDQFGGGWYVVAPSGREIDRE